MWKKMLSAIALSALCLAVAACGSGNSKSAQEENKAQEAYQAGNYSEVVGMLEGEQSLGEEAAEMLSVSKAHVAINEGRYLEAVRELAATKSGSETDIYSDAVDSLIKKALKDSSEKELVEAIELDPSIAEASVKAITEQCDALDYGAFKLMDKMLKKMPDAEAKADLQRYHNENKLNKPKAFLLGKWEWQSGGETKTAVSCIRHKDNLIATVDVVGDNERDYKILKDDVYWKDFDFLEPGRFTCTCLCKTEDGVNVECTTVGTINYKDDTLHLHLTAPDPYWMAEESSDRDWKRI